MFSMGKRKSVFIGKQEKRYSPRCLDWRSIRSIISLLCQELPSKRAVDLELSIYKRRALTTESRNEMSIFSVRDLPGVGFNLFWSRKNSASNTVFFFVCFFFSGHVVRRVYVVGMFHLSSAHVPSCYKLCQSP